MDYDDLIIETALTLRNTSTQTAWRNKYKYIIIDEMQDTSLTQFHAISPLFEGNNIMMCGDFFQTIYEWRGSQPEQVLGEYINEYDPTTYMYRENYRATRILANASFGYLKNVYPQLIGKYCPTDLEIHSSEDGDKIEHYEFSSAWDEAKFIYQYIINNPPLDPTSICIMARSNKYISSLAEYFDRLNSQNKHNSLSFFTVERNQAFYKNASVKDLLAFLRILTNRTDNVSMERIAINFIKNVGLKTVEQIHSFNDIGVTLSAFLCADTFDIGDCYGRLIDAYWNSNIVVYDTETTGLDLTKDQIIQLAAVKYNNQGEIIEKFDQIIIPTVEISAGARATIPYDVDEAIKKYGHSAGEVLKCFSQFVFGSVLVGHNSDRYDFPLLSRQLMEEKLPPLIISGEYDPTTYMYRENYRATRILANASFGLMSGDDRDLP